MATYTNKHDAYCEHCNAKIYFVSEELRYIAIVPFYKSDFIGVKCPYCGKITDVGDVLPERLKEHVKNH